MSSIEPAIILFGHGARDPEWARPMQRVRELVLAAQPGRIVELAFLEFMSPTLDEAIDGLVARGLHHLRVLPMFLAQGGHLKRDVPQLLEAACTRHPGITIELMKAVGEADQVAMAMAAYALDPLA